MVRMPSVKANQVLAISLINLAIGFLDFQPPVAVQQMFAR
jgi:hypothetical protein